MSYKKRKETTVAMQRTPPQKTQPITQLRKPQPQQPQGPRCFVWVNKRGCTRLVRGGGEVISPLGWDVVIPKGTSAPWAYCAPMNSHLESGSYMCAFHKQQG